MKKIKLNAHWNADLQFADMNNPKKKHFSAAQARYTQSKSQRSDRGQNHLRVLNADLKALDPQNFLTES